MADPKPQSIASYRRGPAEVPALLRDEPALASGLLKRDILPWHVAGI